MQEESETKFTLSFSFCVEFSQFERKHQGRQYTQLVLQISNLYTGSIIHASLDIGQKLPKTKIQNNQSITRKSAREQKFTYLK